MQCNWSADFWGLTCVELIKSSRRKQHCPLTPIVSRDLMLLKYKKYDQVGMAGWLGRSRPESGVR